MNFYSNKNLAQKLERTEARSNAEFVNSHQKMKPESKVKWIDVNGTYAMFDGIDSPLTQTFGLGLFNDLTEADLKTIEHFFDQFNAPVFHEVSPMADPAHLKILIENGYQPVEMTNILYKELYKDANKVNVNPMLNARKLHKGEENLWGLISLEGWCADMPDHKDFLHQYSQISSQCHGASSFFVHYNEKPISTGLLYIYDGVALLGGDSTIPDGRNKGGQTALIEARLSYAAANDCTLAMLAASPGSQSQKNAEKNGFNIAYTRTKWKK